MSFEELFQFVTGLRYLLLEIDHTSTTITSGPNSANNVLDEGSWSGAPLQSEEHEANVPYALRNASRSKECTNTYGNSYFLLNLQRVKTRQKIPVDWPFQQILFFCQRAVSKLAYICDFFSLFFLKV